MSEQQVSLVRQQFTEVAATEDISIPRVLAQMTAVQTMLRTVMKENVHFGTIPGTPKPTLYQPGADLLCMLFRMRTEFEIVKAIEEADRIAFVVRCRLFHITAGYEVASAMGSTNSRESRYLNQSSAKTCPKCAKATIYKSKNEGEGWYCWKKKDGCGTTFKEGDPAIEKQAQAILGDKVQDLHNTLLKMACKRAKVAAVLTATAASDVFTQDLEDLQAAFEDNYVPPAPTTEQKAAVARAGATPKRMTGGVEPPKEAPPVAEAPKDSTATNAAPSSPTAIREDASNAALPSKTLSGEPEEDLVATWSYDDARDEWQPGQAELRRSLKQNDTMHALFAELNMADEYRRKAMLQFYNKESSKDLSIDEAEDFIGKLREKVKELASRGRRAGSTR